MKWKVYCKKLIAYLMLPYGCIIGLLQRNHPEIIILLYHRVNDQIHKELGVPVANFQWQMNYLKENRYRVISLDHACELLKTGKLQGKYLVLTFDDGYEDYYYNAFPILKEHGYPSTLYLVPGFIETGRVFWWDRDIGQSPLLTWSQIEELQESKLVTFGSHTVTHRDFDQLNEKEILAELQGSQKILEERLHQSIDHFSYPRGIHPQTAEQLVGNLYRTGVLILDGRKLTHTTKTEDWTLLKRVPIQNSDGKALFIAKINGWKIGQELLYKLSGNIHRKSFGGENGARERETGITKKKLRLLLGITLSEVGGAQKIVWEIINSLAAEEYEITLVTSPGGELIQWTQELNNRRDHKIKIVALPSLCRGISPFRDFRVLFQLYRILAVTPYDVVHFHSSKMGILGPIAAFLARIPRILFTVHGWGIQPEQSRPVKAVLGMILRMATGFCAVVTCVSRYDRERGVLNRWASPAKLQVIHNGISGPPLIRGKLRRELGIGASIPIIGAIARLAEPKDPFLMIRLAQRLKEQGWDFRLVIIGDGPLRRRCESEIAGAHLEAVVTLLGTRMDARELLNDFDISVLFSKWEALPVTVMEAMAAAKPVVASKTGGIPELVRDGENGYLIEDNRLDDAVCRIEKLLTGEGIQEKMGLAGQHRFEHQFTRDRMIQEYQKIYRGEC